MKQNTLTAGYAGTKVILENVNINVTGKGSAALLANAAEISFKGTNSITAEMTTFSVQGTGGKVTTTEGSSTTVTAPTLGISPIPTGITFVSTIVDAVASAGGVNYASLEDAVKDLLNFYMGKNTTERQNFIINNLVVEEDVE